MGRELTYRVNIDVPSARRSAQSIRGTIEAELRQIKMGQLNTSSISAATSEAQRLRHELEQAGRAAQQVNVPSVGTGTAGGGITAGIPGGLAGGLVGGFAAGAIVNELSQVGQALEDLGRRGAVFGQINDVLQDYAASVGTTGEAIVKAAQKAAQGTISEYELILNANRAIQFEVAKTPEQYAKLIELSTALGRAQGISDTQALEYLTTGLARESRLILDNLGLIIDLDAATAQYAATLGKSADQLTAAERKQALLDEAFRQGAVAIAANRDASESAATQFERFDANVQNLKDTFGAWLAEASADKIGAIADAIGMINAELNGEGRQTAQGLEKDLAGLIDLRDKLAAGEDFSAMGITIPGGAESIDFYNKKIEETTERLRELKLASEAAYAFEIPQADKVIAQAQAIEDARIAARQEEIGSRQGTINQGIDSAAAKSVDTLGLEQTLALLKQQKALVDQAVNELIDSAITDPTEITLRLAQAQQSAQQAFTDAVAAMPELPEIDPGITAGSFDIIAQSLTDLNTGFVDVLPNMSAARDELIALQTEVALTGITTEEQAARLEYLSSAAIAVADDTGILSEVTNDLGIAFLAANPEAAGIVDAMYQAQASYLSGAITADQYAGILAVLGGQLLTLASQAGIATGSILALNAAQAGRSGTTGFTQGQTIGGGIASRLKAQEDARARDAARKAALQAAREAENAAKRAAREQEAAAKRAGKALEAGAKKAAQELKSALDKVPGLFGRSQVTEGDIQLSKAGVYLDKADEKLRRLQAEVEQGKDLFGDISISEAKQSLIDLGVQVAEDEKIAFQQFADAWESGLLFFDPANIEKYINEEAVQRDLDLQEKAAQGKDNIYKAFGVAIDDAVDAAVGGISGGASVSGGGVADLQIPITATLEPIPPITETPTVSVQPYFDPVVWSKVVMPTQTLPVQPQMIGPQPRPGTMPTLGGMSPVIDVAAIQGQLDSLTIANLKLGPEAATALKTEIEAISASIPVGLYAKLEVMQDLATIVEATKIGIEPIFTATPTKLSELATAVETQAQINIPVGLFATLEVMNELKTIVGGTKVSVPVSLVSQNADGSQSSNLALGLVGELNRQFDTNANFFYAAGQGPAMNVIAGYKGHFTADSNEGAPLITPMVQAINTQIRLKAEDLKNQGITIAQYVQTGVSIGFNSEAFKSALVAVGESLYASIRTGLIQAADGGDLVEALGSKILADISGTVEAAE